MIATRSANEPDGKTLKGSGEDGDLSMSYEKREEGEVSDEGERERENGETESVPVDKNAGQLGVGMWK